jgi:hypothetical protein
MASFKFSARDAYRLVVWAGFLLVLAANAPGHLSYDSVAQLHEGHFGRRETWGPAFYAWILGLFDRFIPGTALYVAASALLLFASFASLAWLRPRTSWLAVPVMALAALAPQVLIYQGIVWKDVLFANLAVCGLIALAHAARSWEQPRHRWLWLAAALLLEGAAAQTRQNGLVAGVVAALALGWIASRGRLWRGARWVAGGLVAFALASQLIGMASLATLVRVGGDAGAGVGVGLRLVQSYDLVGAAALDPTYRFNVIAAHDPAAARVLQARARLDYTGERIDVIDRDQTTTAAFDTVPSPVIRDQWLDLVERRPGLYLRVRAEDFRWVLTTPVIDRCLAVNLGADAPPRLMGDLHITRRWTGTDQQLANYVSWLVDTPLYRHFTYLALSLALSGFFLWRREPQDIAMLGLQVGSLGFAASFFLISIACDYRYLYFCDLAAIVGLVYLALDPARRPRREPSA